jgi:type II secretory pathway component PulM
MRHQTMMSRTLPAMTPGLVSAWERASTRERRAIALALLVVGGALAYTFLWRPMLADSTRLTRELPIARQNLAAARAQADALIALQRAAGDGQTADPRASIERAAIEAALADHDLRSVVTSFDIADGRARLTFAAVRFAAVPEFLAALQRDDGLRVVEAVITARVEPGVVRAELTLAR